MSDFRTFASDDLPITELQTLLQSVIGPRPICLASTINSKGNSNLSPFSFYNMFSTQPPVVIFSPARRVRDNSIKHTLENILEVPEVCINAVNYSMVWQTSLSSTEYDKETDEFIKAGFHKISSDLIRPFRVAESPAHLECIVNEVKPLGEKPGSGNLIICEIKKIHINENVFQQNNTIHPANLDLVARMGGDWYSRCWGDALFEIEKPVRNKGIGIDKLPESIKNSSILTGNDLGQLANVEQIPVISTPNDTQTQTPLSVQEKHKLAHALLLQKNVTEAWRVLLS